MIYPLKAIKNAIREKLDDEQKFEFDVACDKAKDKIDDVAMFFTSRFNNMKYKAETMHGIAKNGYSHAEIWNFGDYVTVRMSNLCACLYEARYEVEPPYKDELLENEKVFRAIDGFNSTMMTSGHADLISYKDMFDIENEAYEKVFMPAWEWVFETLLTPDVYIAPEKPADNAANLVKLIKGKLTSEITYDDVKNLPVSESKRISSIMRKFANNCHGHPDSYATSENALMTISERGGAKWEDGQSLGVGLMTHTSQYWREYIWNKNNGMLSQKSRKELGVDWIAWLEDILHAGDVFEMYAEWFDDEVHPSDDMKIYTTSQAHMMSLRESMYLIDAESAKEIEEKLIAEARKVWSWMGRNIRGLWD